MPARRPGRSPGAEQVHVGEITADPAISGVFAISLVEDPALSD